MNLKVIAKRHAHFQTLQKHLQSFKKILLKCRRSRDGQSDTQIDRSTDRRRGGYYVTPEGWGGGHNYPKALLQNEFMTIIKDRSLNFLLYSNVFGRLVRCLKYYRILTLLTAHPFP